ncbi:MAG: biosynthetic-type acetolactate synthase large subunit [Deltaproteobacteria bacterium]|nr:biosynthetic-type acetolactate synthase large subunit [Candidatus Anaeroferrophillus wilburensis]MBN2888081.1 biosynthetic-type acetolactate synthase large subunit [Deltaproteobacteria bacterium]
MKKTGAQMVLQSLQIEGVKAVFGYPGGAVINLYDEMPNFSFRHYLVRHEQAAVHAADGYARATGEVGVALVTSGPGATNTVTGLATAYMDSIPLVVFTGQVPTALIGNDAFQEADIVGITRPCTKHNYLVKDVKELPRIIKEAFHIARSGRPGPVLIDLPKDILVSSAVYEYPEKVVLRGYNPTYEGHPGQLRKALRTLLKAKRPLFYVGGGAILADAAEVITRLAIRLQIPVTTTLMGLGAFPEDHDLSLGMLGMHGTYRANMAVTESDVLVAIGARFDDRVTGRIDEFAPGARIIHIDIDPTSISKNIKVDIPIVGDVLDVMTKMQVVVDELSGEAAAFAGGHDDWLSRVAKWKELHKLAYIQDEVIKPQYVVEQIYALTRDRQPIISTEVGQNQMWAAQFYQFTRPRTWLTSGGLGTMGYGLPAALGAQVAFPDRLVIDIAGDGSIQMNIQELATVVQYQLPVKVIILNNGYLGMVRQWQELFFAKHYSATEMVSVPDFVKLAEAYGAVGLRATRPAEVVPVLEQAFAVDKPVLVDVVVAKEENVYPMVPAGQPISKMLLV